MNDGHPRGALLVKVGEHVAAVKLMAVDVLDTSIQRGKEKLVVLKL